MSNETVIALEKFVETIKHQNIQFIVLDVETANFDAASVCQIGLAAFNNAGLVASWGTYINPKDYFDPRNIEVHGIVASDVVDAPLYKDVHKGFRLLEGFIIVQHTGFDKNAMNKQCDKYALSHLNYTWLDSALVVKRTWQEVSKRGFGLGNLSEKFGFTFKHHDAVEDATVTGKILNKAIEDSGYSATEWLKFVKKPLKFFYG